MSVHDVAQVGRNQAVSAKVSSPVGVVTERAMYFRYQGVIVGSHNAIGFAPDS